LELIDGLLPDLSIENVEKLGSLLQKEGVSLKDPKLNAILRKFHRVRFLL